MKNSNGLDFNFDNAPIQSTPPAHPVDRTASRPAPQSSAPAKKPAGFLTADDVRTLGVEPRASVHTEEKAPVISESKPEVKPTAPPAVKKEEPKDYSSAALEIMRRMQSVESTKEPPQPVVSEPSDMGAFLTRKQQEIKPTAPAAPAPAAPATPAPAAPAPVAPVKDVSEVAQKRREMLESFQLDTDAVAAGFESIDEEPDLSVTGVFTPVTEAEVEGGTVMFDRPVASVDEHLAAEGATVVIPDEFVQSISEEEHDEEDVEVIDEYNSIEDAQSIADELIRRKRKLGRRFLATSVIAAMLIVIAFSESIFPFGHVSYFVAVGALVLLAALFNLTTFQSIGSLFGLKPDIDLAPAMAMTASVIQLVVLGFFGSEGITSSAVVAAVAVVSLAINTLSKRITVSRTLANFELIANEEKKQAGAFIAPPASASVLDPKKVGETLIFGRRTTIDLKHFITHSLSPDIYESVSGKLGLVVVTASVIACAVTVITGGTLAAAVSSFAAVCCAGAQIAAAYPSAVLLARTCKKLRSNNVMLSGLFAAKEISEANVVALDSDEIFNDECVSLFKFRTFGNVAPDLAFMTAAALTAEGHSPLAGMFNQIAATTGTGMLSADSVIYENSMGLTGWVDEKKTLLGNRMIMESHSIPVPSMDVDRRILQSGKFPLYLAIDDKIAAMFIIGYEPNRRMLHRLRRLINTGVTLLVRTVDPNVTADLICSTYGLPTGSVEVMSSDASRVYCDIMSPTENEPAIMCAKNAEGFVDAYISSISLNKSAKGASVTAIVLTLMVMALGIGMIAVGFPAAVNVMTLLCSYLVVTVITGIAGLICS